MVTGKARSPRCIVGRMTMEKMVVSLFRRQNQSVRMNQNIRTGGLENISESWMNKIKDYLQLVKLSLSIMVVFSSVISFLLTPGADDYVDIWTRILLLFAGGMLV